MLSLYLPSLSLWRLPHSANICRSHWGLRKHRSLLKDVWLFSCLCQAVWIDRCQKCKGFICAYFSFFSISDAELFYISNHTLLNNSSNGTTHFQSWSAFFFFFYVIKSYYLNVVKMIKKAIWHHCLFSMNPSMCLSMCVIIWNPNPMPFVSKRLQAILSMNRLYPGCITCISIFYTFTSSIFFRNRKRQW